MNVILQQVFESVRSGFSVDRVVVDPELNALFIDRCRQVGLDESAEDLNRQLLNIRKRGGLSSAIRSRRTSFTNEGDYRFAAEIAIRFLERRDRITLDDVICHPGRREEFDAICASIVPGFSPLQYRWAALNLRKARQLRPEIVGHAIQADMVMMLPVKNTRAEQIPLLQGIYIFYTRRETLYVGEASNLRLRLKKHLDHSDNKSLAQWIWREKTDDLHIELHLLPAETTPRQRRAVETELIISRKPIFNIRQT